MKKILLLVTLSFLVSFSVMAQIGIKAGMNFAKQSGNQTTGFSEKSLNNFNFGLFTHKDLIPLLKLRFGLEYSPKGTNWESGSDYEQATFNYLELPVLARVKLGPVYGLGGFYGAYALSGKSKTNVTGTEVEEDIDFDLAGSEMSKFDYGMKFGLGFQLGLGPIHAFAELDYSFGLYNLNKAAAGDEMKNSVIGVSIGVLLGK
ncbi:MAG: hypothetical protein DRI95_08100 [Bacteroidetes bacterium]|nr:MAG: hypothetical protein DRI95_08100 [Bacteroidota bacterium]